MINMSEKEARAFFAKINRPYPLDEERTVKERLDAALARANRSGYAAVAGYAAVEAALAQVGAVDRVQLAAVAAVAQALGVPLADVYGRV